MVIEICPAIYSQHEINKFKIIVYFWYDSNLKKLFQTRPILSETLDDIKKVIENSRKKLHDQDYHIHIKDPIEVDDYIQESDIDYEEDSTTWILLRAKCDKETSETSSEEFNEVQFKDENDLSRPSVDWQIWNDSVLKCQNWLNTLEMNE